MKKNVEVSFNEKISFKLCFSVNTIYPMRYLGYKSFIAIDTSC